MRVAFLPIVLAMACGPLPTAELDDRTQFEHERSVRTLGPARAVSVHERRFAVVFEPQDRIAVFSDVATSVVEGKVGSGPRAVTAVAAGDFDWLTADSNGRTLSAVRTDGDVLVVTASVAVGDVPLSIAAGSNIAAVATGLSDEALEVWRLAPLERIIRVSAPGLTRVAVADLDGDGAEDVVGLEERDARLTVLLASNAYEASLRFDVCDAPFSAAATFERIVIACRSGGVDVLEDVFGSPRRSHLEAGAATYDVVLADFDKDGVLDIAAVDIADHRVHWWDADARHQTIDVERGPIALGATDLDGDGDEDLVVLAFEARAVEILRNTWE